jgi:hypothetical protein
MDWLEQNIDAYRIITEILNELREVFRARLEAVHGKTWYKTGLPDALLDRLIESKEREKAIDWYESEYQEIINYAVFPDLLEILEHNADSFPQIRTLAPTSALLHARFLELEVMRAKLGRARPISETELSFLGTFHLRFRKAIEEFRDPSPLDSATAQSPPAMPPPVKPVTPPQVGTEGTPQPGTEPFGPLHTPPKGQDSPPADKPMTQAPRSATRAPETGSAEAEPPAGTLLPEEGPTEVTQAESTSSQPAKEPGFEEALEAGASQVILRELYKEVTVIAEGIWTKDIPPAARAWEKVCASPWYQNQFSGLGLRPLSDFYEIISKVDQQMRQGVDKDELQSFLKEANFAQVLLSLRDMFQRNHI